MKRLAELALLMFTGKDNVTPDLGRVLWALGVVAGLVLFAYAVVVRGQPFDWPSFGVGLGAALAAGGATLWLKRSTEPETAQGPAKPDGGAQ